MKNDHEWNQDGGGVCIKCHADETEADDKCVPIEGDDGFVTNCPDCGARIRIELQDGSLHRVVHLRHVT